MNPDAVIIGGGVAGLACGCYLQMNGYRSEILEANHEPGGLCVSWDRTPYVFDGCLRWLVGTHPPSIFHRIWNELGALDGRSIEHPREFLRIEGRDGESIGVPADLDQLAKLFKARAPEDSARIDSLVRAARRCIAFEPPENPLEVMGGMEKLLLLLHYFPMLPTIIRWKDVELATYIATYRNPFMREVLMALAGDGRMSALVLVMVLAIRCGPDGGYVSGGSRALSQAIADRYTRLGGVIRYHTQAASVAVENHRAVGVVCEGGKTVRAATVISCADGHATIFNLLGGRYVSKQILFTYKQCKTFPPLIQVSLGIKQTFPEVAASLSLPVWGRLPGDHAEGLERCELSVFGSESGFCPSGRSVMVVRFPSNYEFWTNLRSQDPAGYRKAKAAALAEIVAGLDKRFPGLARNLECSDLATPASFERWTGNWQGSYQGWLPTPSAMKRQLPRTLPGLQNFYMAGHWVTPGGGLPPAALSGRYVAQMICARDRKPFHTALP